MSSDDYSSFPPPEEIPEKAVLLVGYCLGEEARQNAPRFREENVEGENYYFLSNQCATKPKSFNVDFDKIEDLQYLSDNYKNKFHIVIFDYSVVKFLNVRYLKYIFAVVKEGGILVIDSDNPGIYVYVPGDRNYNKQREKQIKLFQTTIAENVKPYKIEYRRYAYANPRAKLKEDAFPNMSEALKRDLRTVLARVYWPRVNHGRENYTPGKYPITIMEQFIYIHKSLPCEDGGCSIMGGGRKTRRRHRTRRSKKTRKH